MAQNLENPLDDRFDPGSQPLEEQGNPFIEEQADMNQPLEEPTDDLENQIDSLDAKGDPKLYVDVNIGK